MSSKRDHGDGGIDQRAPDRWRLRYRLHGRRYTKTVVGTKNAAQKELRRLLNEGDEGRAVAPKKLTVAAFLTDWLAGLHGLSAKTGERYDQLCRNQITPRLGDV